jgi:hypothetical protein
VLLDKPASSHIVKKFPAHILCNPEGSLTHSQPSPLVPILSQSNPVHVAPSNFCRILFILFSHLLLFLPSGLLPSGFPPKKTVCTSPLSHACYMSIPFLDLILFARIIFGESRDHKASHHAFLSSTLLLPRPSYAQICSSAPYSSMPSANIPPLHWATKFDSQKKKGKITVKINL